MKKIVFWCVFVVLLVFVVGTIGGSFYMLDYSLSPEPNRADTAFCFNRQFENYPETRYCLIKVRCTNCTNCT